MLGLVRGLVRKDLTRADWLGSRSTATAARPLISARNAGRNERASGRFCLIDDVRRGPFRRPAGISTRPALTVLRPPLTREALSFRLVLSAEMRGRAADPLQPSAVDLGPGEAFP